MGSYLQYFNFDSLCLSMTLILCVYIHLDVLYLEVLKNVIMVYMSEWRNTYYHSIWSGPSLIPSTALLSPPPQNNAQSRKNYR